MQDRTEPPGQIISIRQDMSTSFRTVPIPAHLVLFVHRGEKRARGLSGQEWRVGPGEVAFFAAGERYTIENRVDEAGCYRATGVILPAAVLRGALDGTPRTGRRVGRVAPDLAGQLEALRGTGDALPPAIFRHRLGELVLWLCHAGIDCRPSGYDVVARLAALVGSDLERRWLAPEVAEALGMSEASLRRRLAEASTRFSDLVLEIRMMQAVGMLQASEMPITEIAYACGFATPSHFAETFRRRMDVSPSAFRRDFLPADRITTDSDRLPAA